MLGHGLRLAALEGGAAGILVAHDVLAQPSGARYGGGVLDVMHLTASSSTSGSDVSRGSKQPSADDESRMGIILDAREPLLRQRLGDLEKAVQAILHMVYEEPPALQLPPAGCVSACLASGVGKGR